MPKETDPQQPCAICGVSVKLDFINRVRYRVAAFGSAPSTPHTPLLKYSPSTSPPSGTITMDTRLLPPSTHSFFQRNWRYAQQYLKNMRVYYRVPPNNEIFYYCDSCGPKVAATYLSSGSHVPETPLQKDEPGSPVFEHGKAHHREHPPSRVVANVRLLQEGAGEVVVSSLKKASPSRGTTYQRGGSPLPLTFDDVDSPPRKTHNLENAALTEAAFVTPPRTIATTIESTGASPLLGQQVFSSPGGKSYKSIESLQSTQTQLSGKSDISAQNFPNLIPTWEMVFNEMVKIFQSKPDSQFEHELRAEVKKENSSIFHYLLYRLSKTYYDLNFVATQKQVSIRSVLMQQGWLYPSIQTRLKKIVSEVKVSIININQSLDPVGGGMILHERSAMLWSMQFITLEAVEDTIIAADDTWQHYLPRQYYLQIGAATLFVFLLAMVCYMAVALRHKKPNIPPPSPEPASSTYPPFTASSSHGSASSMSSYQPTSTIHPRPSSTSSAIMPSSSMPPEPTSSPHHPTSTHILPSTTQPLPSSSIKPSPTPSPSCKPVDKCEAPGWTDLTVFINFNLQLGIKTIGDLIRICGSNVLMWLFQTCYPSNTKLLQMLSNQQTLLLDLLHYLQTL